MMMVKNDQEAWTWVADAWIISVLTRRNPNVVFLVSWWCWKMITEFYWFRTVPLSKELLFPNLMSAITAHRISVLVLHRCQYIFHPKNDQKMKMNRKLCMKSCNETKRPCWNCCPTQILDRERNFVTEPCAKPCHMQNLTKLSTCTQSLLMPIGIIPSFCYPAWWWWKMTRKHGFGWSMLGSLPYPHAAIPMLFFSLALPLGGSTVGPAAFSSKTRNVYGYRQRLDCGPRLVLQVSQLCYQTVYQIMQREETSLLKLLPNTNLWLRKTFFVTEPCAKPCDMQKLTSGIVADPASIPIL